MVVKTELVSKIYLFFTDRKNIQVAEKKILFTKSHTDHSITEDLPWMTGIVDSDHF